MSVDSNIVGRRLVGERALFMARDLLIKDCIFADGESPLKEGRGLRVENTTFQWKYPLWYCNDVGVSNCSFLTMARAGIWYGGNISLKDCLYGAPKGFRKVRGLRLEGIDIPDAQETLWNCSDVAIKNVSARGSYFGMGTSRMLAEGLSLFGDYSFDGCSDIEIRGSKLLSKDAFWNCDNVRVYDSYITGEYIGWNSRNVVLENCTIESLQGFCYMDGVRLRNCKVLNTTLAFEYSRGIDAEILTSVDSIKNPLSGRISCGGVGELIFDDPAVDSGNTEIVVGGGK